MPVQFAGHLHWSLIKKQNKQTHRYNTLTKVSLMTLLQSTTSKYIYISQYLIFCDNKQFPHRGTILHDIQNNNLIQYILWAIFIYMYIETT